MTCMKRYTAYYIDTLYSLSQYFIEHDCFYNSISISKEWKDNKIACIKRCTALFGHSKTKIH